MAATKQAYIQPFDPRPAQDRLADHLRRELSRPENADAVLPPERRLAGQMHVARETLKKALHQLRTENAIRSVPGSGWQVRPWADWLVRP